MELRLIIAYTLLACLAVGLLACVLQIVRYQRDLKRAERGHRRPGGARKPFWY